MITGFTCSAFDLLHAGHILMLKEAREYCDYLIVGLHTNPRIDRKEKNAPIESTWERFERLRGCKFIDEIIPYDTEYDLYNILQSRRIDVRFLGEEYIDEQYTGKDLGIRVHYTKRRHNLSSSALRARL